MAPVYDAATLGDRFYRRARADAVDALHVAPGSHVFDIFCGTGVNLPLLATRVGSQGRISAVDGSDAMLSRARQRAKRLALSGSLDFKRLDLDTVEGVDALAGEVEAAHPAHLLFTLGLSCLANWQSLLERLMAAAPPGARVVILDGHNPELTRDARLTNWIGATDVRRPVWQPLAEKGTDFACATYRLIPGVRTRVLVASATRPADLPE
jgi:demethylmenaquinone methyltransferase/2-methoxy-6-polyprenyl-1,4-benzoquinol methylase